MRNYYFSSSIGAMILLLVLFLANNSLYAQRNKPSANLEQLRNGSVSSPVDPGTWVGGNNGSSNSHHAEDMSAPYRLVMENLSPSSEITITIEYDVQHSEKLALDYLTSYDRMQPHFASFSHDQEEVNPTQGTDLFESPDTPDQLFTIPVPSVTNSPVPGQPVDSYNNVAGAGQAQMAIWNGSISSISYVGSTPDLSSSANQSQQIEITFTTGTDPSGTSILAWGGHIASREEWGFDADGSPRSAGGISGSPYHMRLISWNLGNLGNQDLSLSIEEVSAPDPATAPQNFTGVPASINQIDLSWDPVVSSNTINYVLEFSTTSEDGPWTLLDDNILVTSFNHTSLNSNTTYFYQLKAVNTDGESDYVATSATTPPDLPLSASNLTGSAISDTEIQLNWVDESDNESGFRIERSVGDNSSFDSLTVVTTDLNSINDTGLSSGVLYFYRVIAYTADGDATSPSNEISLQTKPSAPVALDASVITIASFVANWETATGADYYKIDVATDDQFNNFVAGFQDLTVNNIDTLVDGLISNTSYYYRVRGVNSAGASTNSNTVAVVTFADLPATPANFTANSLSTSEIELNWSEVSTTKAVTYTLERSPLGSTEWTEVRSGLSQVDTVFNDPDLEEFTKYFYRVFAINPDGSSDPATANARTQSVISSSTNLNGKSGDKIGQALTALSLGIVGSDPSSLIYQYDDDGDILVEVIAFKTPGNNTIEEVIALLKASPYLTADSKFILPPDQYISDNNNRIDVYVEVSKLDSLNFEPLINLVRPVYRSYTIPNQIPSDFESALVTDKFETGVRSQGDISQTSLDARSSFKVDSVFVDGTGIKIGVLSNSFNTQGGTGDRYITDQANGDLPGPNNPDRPLPVVVLEDATSVQSDEGRAMLQIIHDVAPGAELGFHAGTLSLNKYIEGVNELSDNGFQFIVDDITFLVESFFQQEGLLYDAYDDHLSVPGNMAFTSAGNFGSNAIQGTLNFVPIPDNEIYPEGTTAFIHDFGGGDYFQEIFANPGEYVLAFQWDEPFATFGEAGAVSDLDMYIVNDELAVEAGNNRVNILGDAVEILVFTATEAKSSNIVFTCECETPPSNLAFRMVAFKTSSEGNDGLVFTDPISGPTVTGHAGFNLDNLVTTGASFYGSYGFGATLPTPLPDVEPFSSFAGALPDGQNLAIEITGPDGANTNVISIGEDINFDDDDGDGTGNAVVEFPNFFGTSAAAPHVAAAMALMRSALPSWYPAGVPAELFSDGTFAADASNYANQTLGLFLQSASPVGNTDQTGAGLTDTEAAFLNVASQTPLLLDFTLVDTTQTISVDTAVIILSGDFFTEDSQVFLDGDSIETIFISETELQVTVPPFSGPSGSFVVTSAPSTTPSGLDGGDSNTLDLLDGRRAITIVADSRSQIFGQDIDGLTFSVLGLAEGESYDSLGLPDVVLTSTADTIGPYPDVNNYIITPSLASPLTEEQDSLYVLSFQKGVLGINKLPLTIEVADTTAVYGEEPVVLINYLYPDSIAAGISDNEAFVNFLKTEHEATYLQDTTSTAVVNNRFTAVVNRFSAVVNENPDRLGELIDLLTNSNWMATETSIENRFSPVVNRFSAVVNDWNIVPFDADQLVDYLDAPLEGNSGSIENRFSAVVNGEDLVTGLTSVYDPLENRFSPVVNRFSAVVNRFSPVVNRFSPVVNELGDDNDSTDLTQTLAIVDFLDGTDTTTTELDTLRVYSINLVSGLDVTVTNEGTNSPHYMVAGAALSPAFTNCILGFNPGLLTVVPLPVTVDLDDGDVPIVISYGDSIPIFNSIPDTLAYLDTLEIEYNLNPAPVVLDPLAVDTYAVEQIVTVKDSIGLDVTHNYDLTIINGWLTVNPDTLHLITEDVVIFEGDDLPPADSINTVISGFIPGETEGDVFPGGATLSYSSPDYDASGKVAGNYNLFTTATPDPANYIVVDDTAQVWVNLANGKKIRIFLDCVEETGEGTYPFTAYFRYENDNAVSLYIEPMSAENLLVGDSIDVSTLVGEFLSGSHQFGVKFIGNIRWLVTTFGSTNPSSVEVDSNNLKGKKCKGNDIINGRIANPEAEAESNIFTAEEVQFYPNPVNDRLVVRINDTFTHNDYELYNSQGIRHGVNAVIDPVQATAEFDFTGVEAGLYLLKLNIEGTTAIVRILRQ